MTTLVFELPSVQILEDGTKKYIDSFGNLLKLKTIYGDNFEIEETDGNMYNIHQKYWGKTYKVPNKPLLPPKPFVIHGHEGYMLYPFIKAIMKENDKGELEWHDEEEFICIIPEGFRKKMKPGKYILGTRENAIPSLADYAKNLDTGDIYNAQEIGGAGDIEYRFIKDLITLYDEAIAFFDEVDNVPGMEEILPLCVKRIGYLKEN